MEGGGDGDEQPSSKVEPPSETTTPDPVKDVLQDATPGHQSKPGMGSNQFDKSGGLNQANKDFDTISGSNPVKDYGNGVRSTELPDGTRASVRPSSNKGPPTVQIDPPSGDPSNPIKIRYP
jgi:hypothetical protein